MEQNGRARHSSAMSDAEPSTGWTVKVTRPPDMERFFVVAEPDQSKALDLARENIPPDAGEQLTIGMSVSHDELRGMKRGDVRQHPRELLDL
jgi:hypothetical protein